MRGGRIASRRPAESLPGAVPTTGVTRRTGSTFSGPAGFSSSGITEPPRGAGARPIPDQDTAQKLLRDGIIGSLVPLTSAAKLTNTAVPVTEAMITLGSAILGADIAAAGRRLDTIGITATDASEARRQMDHIATGGIR